MPNSIILTARDIIRKIKENKPVRDELYIYDNKTSDVIEAAFQECKSKVITPDGQVRVHGSTIPDYHVKRIGRAYINNIQEIPEDIVAQAYLRDGVAGPWMKMPYTKQIDEDGKITAFVPELGREIRNLELDNDDLLHKHLYEPLAKLYLQDVPNVNGRLKIRNIFSKKRGIEDIRKDLEKAMLEDCQKRGIDTSRVATLAGWLAISMGANISFKNKVISGINMPQEKNAKQYSGVLGAIKDSIEKVVLEHLYSIDGRAETQIMNDINAQLNAFSQDISTMDEHEILATINEVNVDTLRTSYDLALHKQQGSGLRDCDVVIGDKETGTRCVGYKNVPKAMENFAAQIKSLLDKADELTDVEYINEVAKLNYRFIRIHPFPDGNGRTSRALVNMLMSKKDSIIVFDKKEKNQYTQIMQRASERIDNGREGEYLTMLSDNPKALDELESTHLTELSSYIAEKHFRHVKECPQIFVPQRDVQANEVKESQI